MSKKKKAKPDPKEKAEEFISESGVDMPPPSGTTDEKFEFTGSENQASLYSISHRITNLEDALNHAKVDRSVWMVDKYTLNSWEGYAKINDAFETVTLYQVKAHLKRIIPVTLTKAINSLFEKAEKHSPTCYRAIARPKHKSPCMLEVSLCDAHFGKLAWARETGDDYDLKITSTIYQNAIIDLLDCCRSYEFEKVLFITGNDFYQVDNSKNTTTAGTFVDADGRLPKIIETGEMAVIKAIDTLRQIAPVETRLVAGNHDRDTSYHQARMLSAWYRNDPEVSVDVDPKHRKYVRYGAALIGFTHGDQEKHTALPGLMAIEMPKDWAEVKHREWHIGHGHRNRKIQWVDTDTNDGVVVRMLPSLSGTDSWHHSKGFIGSRRTGECYIWSKEHGYRGHFSVNARMEK